MTFEIYISTRLDTGRRPEAGTIEAVGPVSGLKLGMELVNPGRLAKL